MERFSKAYALLGLTHQANMQEVKRAYRKLALRYHPDLNSSPGAQEKFLLVKKAYDVIVAANKNFDPELDHFVLKKKYKSRKKQGNRTFSREEYLRKAREKTRRYEAMKLQREAMYFARFKKSIYYPWTLTMSYVSLVFVLLIIIDAFTVNIVHDGYVVDKQPVIIDVFGFEKRAGYRLQFDNGSSVTMGSTPGSKIGINSYVSLAETMIFRDIPKIHVIDRNFRSYELSGFNKPPYLFFLIFLSVPIFVLFVDRPSAVFYSAGAFARYVVVLFIASFLIL
ncbi:MAG: J domain-containing protein [Salibacteraceae bacterium]